MEAVAQKPLPRETENPYKPELARIVRIHRMVPDNHLFQMRFVDPATADAWRHRPGQFVRAERDRDGGGADLHLLVPDARRDPRAVRAQGGPGDRRAVPPAHQRPGRHPGAVRERLPGRGDGGERPADRGRRPRDGAAAFAALVRARPPREIRAGHAHVRGQEPRGHAVPRRAGVPRRRRGHQRAVDRGPGSDRHLEASRRLAAHAVPEGRARPGTDLRRGCGTADRLQVRPGRAAPAKLLQGRGSS